MSLVVEIVTGGVCLAAGAGLSWSLVEARKRRRTREAAAQAEMLLCDARDKAAQIIREASIQAEQETQQKRQALDSSFNSVRKEQEEREQRLAQREELLNTQLERVVAVEQDLKQQLEDLSKRAERLHEEEAHLADLTRRRLHQLETMSGLTREQAREQFLKEVEEESSRDAAKMTRGIVEEARRGAEDKARQILSTTIQRYASAHTNEVTTTTISLDDTDIKGRIIGREGRNIRAFENATGVTVLIDDTPNVVVLSSFDPVRREIARESMMRLIQDGRIHPNRIEEIVAIVSEEMEGTINRLGEEAVSDLGLSPLHPDIVALLGRLHFRRSYSQNLLSHSVEVGHLMGLMAAELGINIPTAKRAGLLHDIGKAVDHEVQGPHAIVGADLLRRCGEDEAVINGVASHHNDVAPEGVLGILVNAADAISASRPGARSENMTTYLKRVEDLERIGNSVEGVEKCYALQAGRELRVFVKPGQILDEQAFGLARQIAKRVESELQYPGQIRITVIRETRCVELAK